MSKVLLRMLIIVAVLAGLGLSLLAPIDEEPYQKKPYYNQMRHSLDSLQGQMASRPGDTLQAGWSRQNITPGEPLKLMGYGWKGNYEAVHDSLMLRCFVFDNGQQKVALLSYDLMIVHPDLAAAVQRGVNGSDLSVDGLYFAAVHTHKGYGEWAKGPAGKLTAGGYNEDLVAFIVQQTILAIRQADAGKKPVKIGYASYAHPRLIRNRLTKGDASDDLLRVMQLQQYNGNTALLCTFAAHATFIDSRSLQLSADYPSSLVQALEQHPDVDFAAFAAGAVGSHSPYREGEFSYAKMQSYAEQLAKPVLSDLHNLSLNHTQNLQYFSVPLLLGEPQLKVAAGWRVRPWLFRAFFGELFPELTVLRLGDIALLGVPADFSGMLYQEINAGDLKVVATSFNGGYIGYVIPDEHYHLPHREARELNWFGPHTGSYVTEVMNRSLNLLTR